MEKVNFINVQLVDNDFGDLIRKALDEGCNEWGHVSKFCPILWKRFIIAYIIGHGIKRNVERQKKEDYIDIPNILHIQKYLEKKLRVTFERHSPEEDHDSGSAYLDINGKKAYVY